MSPLYCSWISGNTARSLVSYVQLVYERAGMQLVKGCAMRRVVLFFALASGMAVSSSTQQLAGPTPLLDADFPTTDARLADLGHLLFFDPILSGNKNIACATCHHPALATSDAMSLSFGEGGTGLGAKRTLDAENRPLQRIPRNAPALFNLGARGVQALFHDGRVEADPVAPFGIRMPDGRALPRAVPSLLAAQSMLPILSHDEMAGHEGENEIADAVAEKRIQGAGGAWDLIASRVEAVPAYQEAFLAINGRKNIFITDIAAAIGEFIADEFRAVDSLADRYVAGQETMPQDAILGAELFNGKAGCSSCHSGPLLSDGQFHAIAMPQIGPGKTEGRSYYRDTGRYDVTGDTQDMYRFRTPSLRNIAITAPYGHDGAFANLEDVVRHHLDPVSSLMAYNLKFALLDAEFASHKSDVAALLDREEISAIAAANELAPVSLSGEEIEAILAYLKCLTDESSLTSGRGVPGSVPSGLALDTLE